MKFIKIFIIIICLFNTIKLEAAINSYNRNGGVYYGWPISVNGSSTVAQAVAHYSNWQFIVFGEACSTNSAVKADLRAIMSNLHRPGYKTKCYGYVSIGSNSGNNWRTLTKVTNLMKAWYTNYSPYIDGFFLDEFSYDWGAKRYRQNVAVDKAHNWSKKVIANGWFPDHCMGLTDDPAYPNSIYNPTLQPSHLSNGDYYCYENWVWSTTNGSSPAVWNNKDQWKSKTLKVMEYHLTKGINVVAISVEQANYNQFGSATSRPHEDFAFWCVLGAGFTNFQFSEFNFSSGNNRLYLYTNWRAVTNNVGNYYTSDYLQEVTNGIFYRYTDTGVIRLNWNTHTGSFIPLSPDTNKPVFLTNNFIPLKNEANVSFNPVILIEVTDNRGVLLRSINCQINGTNAITNGQFLPLYSGSESKIIDNGKGGYCIYIDRTNSFGINSSVAVKVWCSDGAGNKSTNIYSFTTGSTNSCITIDGDLSDWPGYAEWNLDNRYDLTNDKPANILRNYFFDGIDKAKVSNLYIAFWQEGLLTGNADYGHQVYFDVDNNSSTGNTTDVWWQKFGAEYYFEFYTRNGKLEYCEGVKKWTNNNWVNTGVIPKFGVNTNKIEISVPLSKLRITNSVIGIVCASYSTNWVDVDGNNGEDENKYVYRMKRKVCPDNTPPVFLTNNFDPKKNENSVSFRANIYIEVIDDGLVASNSINVQVNGTNAIVNGAFRPLYNGSESSIIYNGQGGYNITIDRTNLFAPFSVISVKVWCSDKYGNWSTNIYSFTTGGTNECISPDGNLSDWPGYAMLYSDPSSDAPSSTIDIIKNYVFDGVSANGKTNLYIAFKFKGNANSDPRLYEHLIYIDSDRNSSTGNRSEPYWVSPVMGADYKIDFYTRGGNVNYIEDIFRWNGSSWVATGIKPIIGASSNAIEIIIPLRNIGNPSGSVDLTFCSVFTNHIDIDSNNDGNQPVITYTFYHGFCEDKEPPTFATNNFYPKPAENNVPFSTSLYIEIDDNGGVASNKISVKINGVNAIINGVFQPGYNGPESRIFSDGGTGLNVIIDPTSDFSREQIISVQIIAGDFQNNYATNLYYFVTGSTNVCITIDGDISDFGGYSKVKMDYKGDNISSADIIRVFMFDGSTPIYVTNLYFGFKFANTQNNGEEYVTGIFIDADNNSSTGNPTSPWFVTPPMGADYYIEIYTLNNLVVYKAIYSNSSGSWVNMNASASIEASINEDELEVAVRKNILSRITGSTLRFAFTTSRTDRVSEDDVPDSGNSAIKYSIQNRHCRDTVPPYLANSFPKNGALGMSPDWNVEIWLNDNGLVVSNSIIIRIDEGGSGANIRTAFSNGRFKTNYSTGSISAWNNGWYLVIDPKNNFPKSSLIVVYIYARDLDNNICSTNFSFTTAYTTYNPPPPPPPGINKPFKQGAVYYGWPTFSEGGKDEWDNPESDPPYKIQQVAGVWDDYYFIVLGHSLVTVEYHTAQWTQVRNIISNIKANPTNKTKIFGYIPLGCTLNYPLSTITNQFLRWREFNVDGIFWDEFGYDYAASCGLQNNYRARQNAVLDLTHNYNLIAIINGWNIDHCFTTNNDPSYPNSIYNPSRLPDHAQPGDIFCNESFFYANGSYWSGADLTFQIQKAYKCMELEKTRGIKSYALSTEPSGYQWGQFDTASSIKAQIYTFYAMLLFGFDYYYFTDRNYSATVGDNYLYYLPDYDGAPGFPSNWFPYVGTMYTSDVRTNSTSPLILERCTDYGRIWVNFTSYTGGFNKFTTYYVNGNPAIGNNGYTPSQAQNEVTPWLTIGHAISNASPGSIIKVKGSSTYTYNESVIIPASGGGFCFDYIQIIGYGNEPVILNGQNSRSYGIKFTNNSSRIKIENIEIKNYLDSGIYISTCASSNIIIKGCNIHHNLNYGIRVKGRLHTIYNNSIWSNGDNGANDAGIFIDSDCADNNIVHNNNIYGNRGYGIYINDGDSNEIANNKVYNNSAIGIYVYNNANNNGVSLNTLYKNSGAGISISGSTGVKVQNNTSVKNQYGYYFTSSATIKNNISYSNSNTGYYSTVANTVTYSVSSKETYCNANINGGNFLSGTGCMTNNPQFSGADIDDYRLSYSSPAINRGSPTTDPAAIGGTVTSVKLSKAIPGAYASHTNTFTIYANTSIPSDAQICFSYPPGWDISGAKLLSKSFDGGAYVSIYLNEIAIIRDGKGTPISGGTSIKVVLTNIRNTATPGGQTVQWYIKNANGDIIMGPQQSNDIYILEPFAIIARTPNPGATNVSANATVDVYFSQNVNTSTLNTNTFYVTDDLGNKVAGSFTMISSNAVRFTPSIALPPNCLVTVTVTTDLEATTTQTLVSNNYWSFTVGPGPTTPHYYHTITLDGSFSEWDPVYNYITYDSSLAERVGRDTSDTCAMDTTNFYVTWDSNYIYFGIKKNNNANINNMFRDLIAIDITKDLKGATSFDDSSEAAATRSYCSPSFGGRRRPEFIIDMTYNWSGNHWNNGVCWKWNDNTKTWVKNIFSVTWGFNNSAGLEVRMPISALTNASVGHSSGIPNRIAVQHFVSYNPGCGNVAANNPPQDYCPDDGRWINVDIDNDGNDIPDKLPPMYITYQYPAPNGECNVNDNISIGFSDPINPATVNTNNIWIEYNGSKVAGTFIVTGTNIVFDPSSTLLGGETYTIVITLNVRSTSGKSLQTVTSWNFTPQPGPETPHIYTSINCDHNKSDWNASNPVTWDSSYTSKIATEGPDPGSPTDTTNLWICWDRTKLYFRLDKDCASNTSGILWQDFIAIDITRNSYGADSFRCTNSGGGTASYTFTFSGNEKPEFIISLRHDSWAAYYASIELRKWTSAGWVLAGTVNTHFGYQGTIPNSSDFVECWLLASFLTNSYVGVPTGIPNRIKIKSFMHNNSYGLQDYCPEDGSWREVHIDNNGDDILDRYPSLELVSSTPTNYQKNVALNTSIYLVFNNIISNNTVSPTSVYVMDSDLNKVSGSFNVSGSNITFTPSSSLKPNEFYTIVITTNLRAIGNKKAISPIYIYFYTTRGFETGHTKHSITLDASLSDWLTNNNVTYDYSKTERVAIDWGDATPAFAATSNLYLTWDNNNLYFAIVKNNNGAISSPGWYDYLAIDISRDNKGGTRFGSAQSTNNFGRYRLPDFILYNNHVGNIFWNRAAGTYPLLYKWNGTSYVSWGTLGTDFDIQTTTYNNSKYLEGWIRLSSLTNRIVRPEGDLPNRVSIIAWADEFSAKGPDDYCPEFATTYAPSSNWITIDIDNNDDNIPDGATPTLHLINISPLNGSTNVLLNSTIKAVFDMNINSTTVSTSTFYLLDSDFNKVAGSFNVTSRTVWFTPSANLKPNEFYTLVITTNVYSTINVNLDSKTNIFFYTTVGTQTFHYYHTISPNANPAGWNNANNITYDNSKGERIARDISESGGVSATTNLWITWNTNTLYFMLVKNNNGSSTASWIDYIAFDITRDTNGAINYNDANAGTVKFSNNRKPEYILIIPHNTGAARWDYNNTVLKKYTSGSWNNTGTLGVDFAIQSNTYNNSHYLEGWIKFSSFGSDIPNRIAILNFVGAGGSVQDYTPEMPNSQNASNKYWVTFDPDNNGDNVADGVILYLHIINNYPTNRAKNISLTTNIFIKFDNSIDSTTVSTSTIYLQDSDFNKVSGVFSVSGSNVIFDPSTDLKPNEFYTITVTTYVKGSFGQSLSSNAIWHFYTRPGTATSHNYNTITLDAELSDWDNSNNVTYNNTKTENIASDSATEDGTLAHTTTNLKITWDGSKLYFALVKKNAGTSSADWYDFIAFDVTRDDRGAERFTNSLYCGTVHFMDNRKPEYIMQLDHTEIAYRWDRDGSETFLYKYNGNSFDLIGGIGINYDIQPETYNNSQIVEGYINLSIFTDEFGRLPNRVAVMSFSALRNDGYVYDFCPEMIAPQTTHCWATNKYWVTFDIDNNDDEVADGSAGLTSLSIVKYISNVKLGGTDSSAIPGATIEYVIKYSNTGSTPANNVIIYDRIETQYVIYKTNLIGTASGWSIEYSTNTNPDQSYDSSDYTTSMPANKSLIKWVRWKKASVDTSEDGLTLRFSVIIK